MSIKTQVNEDLKTAMKSGDKFRRDVLRVLSAAFKQIEVDSKIELTDEDVIKVLKKEAKRREESIVDLEKGGRDSSAERAEFDLISAYLPQQLDKAAIAALAKEAIAESGATSAKEMGAIMKVLMPKLQGQADGKLVNEVVRELLS